MTSTSAAAIDVGSPVISSSRKTMREIVPMPLPNGGSESIQAVLS